MCITFFDWLPQCKQGERMLVLCANRDEVLSRPSSPAAFWEVETDILGGTDLDPTKPPYGTWLAVSKRGKLALLTNYRQPTAETRSDARGRGALVHDFIRGHETPAACAARVHAEGHLYNGFNLLMFDFKERSAVCVTNMEGKPPTIVAPGIHGLTVSAGRMVFETCC